MMRPPPHPLRFRVRSLMVAVAVIAVALGSLFWLSKRHDRFVRLAAQHSSAASRLEYQLVAEEQGWGNQGRYKRPQRILDLVRWHDRMSAKYARAAFRPWLSAPLDPPEVTLERVTSHQ
jgi:hypothetical protein